MSEQSFAMNDAIAHLRAVDPVVGALIDRHGTYSPRVFHDPYARLLTSILFQQLAGSAARSIMRRWLAIYSDGERMPTPHELLATSDEQFRLAGVSKQKAGYMRDLALHVLEGRLELGRLEALPDEEVVTRLTAVKGIGVWTAHMFLMFHLARPDVLPVGDLGVRNGMRLAYGLAETPGPRQAAEIGERWRPYRSVGSWYMWRAAETVLQPASPGSAAEAAAGPQE